MLRSGQPVTVTDPASHPFFYIIGIMRSNWAGLSWFGCGFAGSSHAVRHVRAPAVRMLPEREELQGFA